MLELAHRTVTGQFQGDWDNLVSFIENEQFTITQRRDSTVIDKELTRRYGVDTTKDIVIIDTLRICSCKRFFIWSGSPLQDYDECSWS